MGRSDTCASGILKTCGGNDPVKALTKAIFTILQVFMPVMIAQASVVSPAKNAKLFTSAMLGTDIAFIDRHFGATSEH